jgi:hypothetical protein
MHCKAGKCLPKFSIMLIKILPSDTGFNNQFYMFYVVIHLQHQNMQFSVTH